jgi:MinD-like ATPase involved in chromosome partitioning or flagellar assembly
MNPEEMTDKQTVIDVLQRLPDNASIEDIRYETETILSILEGLRDADEGRTYSHEEVMEDVRKWMQKSAGQPAPAENSTRP